MPRPPLYDKATVLDGICERLARGETLRRIVRGPGMPSYDTLMYWGRRNPAVKARLEAAGQWRWRRRPAGVEAALIDRIDEHLSRGWTLHRVCKEPWAPSYGAMLARCRADPALKGRLRRAQQWGVQFRPRHNHDRFFYDYDRVDAFLDAVRRGRSVVAMQRLKAAPDQQTLRAWKHMRPDFVARYDEAKQLGRRVRDARPRWPFDQDLADRILGRVHRGDRLADILREPGMPGPTVLRRWKTREPRFAAVLAFMKRGGQMNRARANPRGGPSPELAEEIGERLAVGATLTGLSADPGMPCRNTLGAWRRRDPAFAKTVAAAVDFRDWIAAERSMMLVEDGGEAGKAEQRRIVRRLRRAGEL